MTPERWQQVEALFHEASRHAPEDRSAFLDRACGVDDSLRREVESLLAADSGATGFLEPAAFPATPRALPEATEDARARLTAALASRYTIERELGRGGMATVYLAQDLRHRRPVALKVMHPALGATLGAERFLREIRITAHLQHPHILPMLDSGEAEGLLWYAMPFVQGQSLRERLRRESQLSVDSALDIARQVALALDCAHREGVVHRDLKPENILMSAGQALVADFGVATALEAGAERITETGMAVGTPQYMSPEQATGAPVDARSDVYALASVLFEMLAGEPPYTGPTPRAVLAKRMLEPVPHVRTLRETVPESVERALTRALAKTPADRFASAAEFAQALEVGPDETRHIGTAPAPGTAMSRRRWTPLRLVLSLLLGLGVGAVAMRWRSGRTPGTLDADLVAVAPFNVLAPGLQLWREGLADLLARDLDGAGPLRTVSPTVVIRGWQGSADPVSAGAAAARVGAGLALFGTLVPEGRDSVRLSARLLDAARAEITAEAEARGPADEVARLAELLVLRLLTDLGRTRPLGTTRSGGLAWRSLPALRAFLRGEQFFRRAEWDSASVSYERAVEQDSAFALAYWRLGEVRAWQFGAPDSLALVHYLRALRAGQERLPPRERLRLGFDSLMSTLDEAALPDSAVEQRVSRLLRMAEELTRRYPADPEAWAALGEAGLHFGIGRGVSRETALRAFARAIALDSAYAPAYLHTVELAATLDDRPAVRRYAAAFLARQPQPDRAVAARTAVRILDTHAAPGELHRLLDTLPPGAYPDLIYDFRNTADSEEIGLAVWRAYAAELLGQTNTEEMESRSSGLAATLAYRGHLREARDVLAGRPGVMAQGTFTELALAGLVQPDTAEAVFRRQLHQGPTREAEGLGPRMGFPLPWWTARRDTMPIKRYAARLRPERPTDPVPLWNRYLEAAAEAYLSLIRADTADAVRRLQGLPAITGRVWYERLTLARLLGAIRHDREALAVLDRGFPWAVPLLQHAPWALERARVAERLGEREKARQSYGYVARVWRHADAELQPMVVEAREGLRRLSTDEGPSEVPIPGR